MDLKERLESDLKAAMKSGDKLKVSTVRMLLAEIKNEEIAKRGALSEVELQTVLSRQIRKHRESIEEFARGGRQDLVDKETSELEFLNAYMPEQLSEVEVKEMVARAIEESGATSPADLGKVMGLLMPALKGKADGKTVNRMVREMLSE